MSRWYPEGDPIKVMTDSLGVPRSFTWRGKRHPVVRVTRRWRIDEDWWRNRVWREYFKLVTRTGMLVEIYHDLLGSKWFVQRIYD